jgi:hypothetical protein
MQSLVGANLVHSPDDGLPELPSRYPTLGAPFDVCETLVHLASWLSMMLPHGWRRPIRIADADGGDVDCTEA